ncbi:Flp family type IVb pilin [Acetobacter okinawensis]|uniref:Flp family type IVb pilin n=1 Tax=Acetobacter okinawensis TaxID=1076594 RepID=UPI001BAB4DA9|nr:Flp family type IVb pilin [Acetobacter okinawensis]MBS0965974.1 Flp family type IVb pilin [Acetobacter okinawensis]
MIYYKKKIQQDVGATAVEYGILSALIAVVTILGLQATGTNLGTTYCTVANQLSQAVGAGNTASGCSATSSSSSSSSSADSSGSSADSSSSSSSSDSSSDSSSSSSTPATYDASNSYTAGSTWGLDNMTTFITQHVQGMTGIYDADGNEITSPIQFAETLGVSAEDYQTYADVLNGTNPDRSSVNQNNSASVSAYNQAYATAQTNAQNQIKSDMANNPSANIYIPDVSKVTETGSDGRSNQTATYAYEDVPTPTLYIFQNSSGTFGPSLYLNKPTGD